MFIVSDFQVMKAKDAIFAGAGECQVTLNNETITFAQVTKLEAKIEKTKTEVKMLGSIRTGNKATGSKGTGTIEYHANTNLMRDLIKKYEDDGEDFYFDIKVVNDDKTSSVGRQIIFLRDCNIDNVTIASLEAGGETLSDSCSFTFESWDYGKKFNELELMGYSGNIDDYV